METLTACATRWWVSLALLALSLIACATTDEPPMPEDGDSPLAPPAAPATPAGPAPPWDAPPLSAPEVPDVYLEVWRRAENRDGCAPIAPADPGEGAGGSPRAATFSGGWGVAYDLPELRSAFGVAGTGSLAADPAYAEWPDSIAWPDGSEAQYGPEGGTGPNQLAYLRIAGQRCLYNIWSRLGTDHLEHLLGSLRFVAR